MLHGEEIGAQGADVGTCAADQPTTLRLIFRQQSFARFQRMISCIDVFRLYLK